MLKTAVAIRHVPFEDLGTFEQPLVEAGFRLHYYDIGVDELWTLEPVKTDLVIVLGGPVGVYDTSSYPFLIDEIALLKDRLAANRPTLGICLGAQLMAAALGARVAPGDEKEIGFAPLTLTEAGAQGPLARLANVPVLHWHGDSFAIPNGAEKLAETPACANQAFALGPNILGLQFHPEADAKRIERWLIGHACELATAGLDPSVLRTDAARYGAPLRDGGRLMFSQWLKELRP
ncbi:MULTISPECIES: glutamine amidotransferase [unclassified Sphingobium]|uniref:glutamine amidotransferase n=1 Tax=unclassified Sphingobium TaxID=2611147 RepID=UPI000D172746|nr:MULTISPECIES: glutamine amidotransferase [unclassified Sphingobium]MBG6116543.1 GMP synthase (glutamine-hydrolyzing) [Sphingobium sp. JAI105]PSO10841.1 glutamine amidotransferase [Sphingobium sp. AEW4]TWD04423.1 GMP synthase (glutamine-hydrolysing) [Sphingobium sp. AEW010]TWD21908.1 GMP synthase (glutamine-hydrolysing) [Sphingobium sp. AEW013]TWD24576.1 GMP synthase (glutamine-hydrolysing) [Sphingobium sp. AEW001]